MQNKDKSGTDLATVLMSEADFAQSLPKGESQTFEERMMPDISDAEASMMQTLSGTDEDPAKALLRESREQTRLLQRIEKHTLAISTMVGFLVALGMCGFIMLCISLFG